MTHDVFISYSSKDKTIADGVCAKLEQLKIRCWIAPRDITAGQNFAKSIINAIDSCKVFVLIWSSNTNTSEHILNEINRAFDKGIPIIPFRIQDVQPTPEMSYYFGRTHWLDAITPPLENHIGALASNIFAILGETQSQFSELAPVISEPVKEVIKPPRAPGLPQPSIKEKSESIHQIKKKSEPKQNNLSTRIFKNKKVLIPLFISLFAITSLVLIFSSGIIKAFSPAETIRTPFSATTTSQVINDVVSTHTPAKPSPTATSFPAWVSDFSEPLLLALSKQPFSFEDDFSRIDSTFLRWGSDPGVSISDGAMYLRAAGGEANAGGGMSAQNFIVSYEFTLITVASEAHISLLYRTVEGGNYSLTFSKDGSWSIAPWDSQGTYNYYVVSGKIDTMEMNRTYFVLLIVKGNEMALYLDDQPVGYGQDDAYYLGNYVGFNIWSPQGITVVKYDNVKFWNLDTWDLDNLKP